ncbi:4Fe-4S dicluster domain-containing protein [Adlercreutzia sp. ZJ242]|uniref:4Fe-4S dicluster domain-containing protein n=1 Tax=Adlercreutzia sp. ZJ242 TaxID=2709409 RepID=UPI0019825A6D
MQEEPGASGPRFRQVVTLESEDGSAPVQYVSMACMHCGDAACMSVCPAGAIYRDHEFGAVLVDHAKCLGCRYCSWACEFGAPQFDRDGLMVKCDMCIDRLREGKKPACVQTCCGGAITLEPVEGGVNAPRETAARRMSAAKRLL